MRTAVIATVLLVSPWPVFAATCNPISSCVPSCAQELGDHVQATADTNYYIAPGQCLVSNNRAYTAVMQTDGNFVVYPTAKASPATNLFNTKTHGNPNSGLLVQADGHLVIYKQGGITRGQDGKYNGDVKSHIWVSGPAVTPNADYYLIMQDDNNLVLYKGTPGKENGYTFDRRTYVAKQSITTPPPAAPSPTGSCRCSDGTITGAQCRNDGECSGPCSGGGYCW